MGIVKRFAFTDTKVEGLSEKIFLDRYADKERDVTKWELDHKVIALVAEDPTQPLLRKSITALIRKITIVPGVQGAALVVEDISDGAQYSVSSNNVEYPKELVPAEMWHRVAASMANVENPDQQQKWYDAFAYALDDWKLVPGGRVAAGAGSDDLTLMNCYVIDSPKDSRHGIMETLEQMTEIMSRGGGVGINLSTLRPKRALVEGVRGHSSGAVSWGGLYSYTTGLIEQGGSRRGALMLMLNDWHPDLMDFITVKQKSGMVTNANLSVCVSNGFMNAVAFDLDWTLEFPDTKHPSYDTEWTGDLKAWKEKGYPVNVYEVVKARKIWNEIIVSAWKSAEPGVVYMEMYNDYSNSWYFNPVICTNPCGEQGLPAWGVCNLSAVNLSKFYDAEKNDVAWDDLGKIVRIGVRFGDNVSTASMYPLPQQKKNQQEIERRIGLGTMGLAELMIKLGIRYGSEEGMAFLDKLYGFMAREAYLASADIAEEKGSFGAFEFGKFIRSKFMQNMITVYPEVLEAIRKKGMRNVTVITQAPTGSTGTMVGTSTGIEPYFAFEYFRQGRLGSHKQYVPIAKDWLDAHPGEALPAHFVTAQDLSPVDHIRVQAAIQRWTDSSISKTANCPAEFTVEQTRELYELAFKMGCKGVTIYRDGSRDIQVLSTTKSDAPTGLEPAEQTQDEEAFESTLEVLKNAPQEAVPAEDTTFKNTQTCSWREENGQIIRECH